MTKYVVPEFLLDSFNCPNCGAFAHQQWYRLTYNTPTSKYDVFDEHAYYVRCYRCEKYSFWVNECMVFPAYASAPPPNADMPNDVRRDYLEAREISGVSPRGAAALLRLSLQKLCAHLGGTGKRLDDDIADLVKRGLPTPVQQSLDIVRVIGNNAVHPGEINVDDNSEVVQTLFGLLNLICDVMITQSRSIQNIYNSLPKGALDAISRRDGAK